MSVSVNRSEKRMYSEKSDIVDSRSIKHHEGYKDRQSGNTAKNRQRILYGTIKVVYACLSCAVSIDLVGIS